MSFGTLKVSLITEIPNNTLREPLLRTMLQNRLDGTIKLDTRGNARIKSEAAGSTGLRLVVECDDSVADDEIMAMNVAMANLCQRPEAGFSPVQWVAAQLPVNGQQACYSV
jgi:hypothetical protein